MSQPHCAQTAPYGVELEEGQKYFFCTCGLSQNQPVCDGAHKGLAFKSQCFSVESSGKVWLCGCKQSKNFPFCDGSHKGLDEA